MGLCKCQRRKVTNLFCFEHDVNVCEYCLVSDHESCIVQSYVQWLQDSDYNPICILCKNLLKDEPTVRLICYDVFHWSCLDKYASELPANTAPAGYQCPKCKECIFPPPNFVSPVADALRLKLENVNWSRVGLGQSLINVDSEGVKEESIGQIMAAGGQNTTDEESNGYVIVNQKDKEKTAAAAAAAADVTTTNSSDITTGTSHYTNAADLTQTQKSPQQAGKKSDVNKPLLKPGQKQAFEGYDLDSITPVSHNRVTGIVQSNQEQMYDPTLGIVLNIDNLDRDSGENKYKRRPLLEWLSRFIRSRQISSRRPMFRMTRQKKIMFIVLIILIALFTLILLFSRLGSSITDYDPALDPMNNPNIRVQ